jgi:hypothetical protein
MWKDLGGNGYGIFILEQENLEKPNSVQLVAGPKKLCLNYCL